MSNEHQFNPTTEYITGTTKKKKVKEKEKKNAHTVLRDEACKHWNHIKK
jgi:hypothetical protein